MRLLTILLLLVSFPITSQNDCLNLCAVSLLRPFAAETDFEKAEKLFREQKYGQAKLLFESILKDNPKNYRSIEYLGDIAAHQKNWQAALAQYKILQKQFPNVANYHYKMGGALAMIAKSANVFKAYGMVDEIENAFLTAAKLDAKHLESRWALVIFYIELPALAGGSEKKAQVYANGLLQLSKVDGYLAKGYIDCYFHRYQNAEKHYIAAHQIGQSKTTFRKLYDLYSDKIKDRSKAQKLKEEFEK